MKATKALRALLKGDEMLITVGAYDALSAKLIEEAGVRAIYTTGFGISASHLGKPDAELYTMTENLAVVSHMTTAVKIPVIADIDTGYGNAVNVMRTVEEFERAGCAGGVLEDQLVPKRCPACADLFSILPVEEALGKIRAAVDARKDPDFVIIARTDAKGAEAVRRANAYAEAGADVVVLISKAFATLQELKTHCREARVPLCVNIMEGIHYASWLNDPWSGDELREAGVKILNYPLVPLFAAAQAVKEVLKEIPGRLTLKDLTLPGRIDHTEFLNLIGFPEINRLQEKYMPSQDIIFGKAPR
jgi:2-methylisocitrate lyase-like PEP mutase family enzyme